MSQTTTSTHLSEPASELPLRPQRGGEGDGATRMLQKGLVLIRLAALSLTGLVLTACTQPPPMPAAELPPGAVPYGRFCYAGAYSCPASGPVGAQCACPGLGAPSYGSIR
jgi:hypothetical protein